MTFVALTVVVAACLPVADAPIPPGYGPLVESARLSVLGNYEGLSRPSLAVTHVRCFANGGVVILFRQVGGPTPGEPAFAMGEQDAVLPEVHAWSGGYGEMRSIDEEIGFNFGNVPEVSCPPRGT